jgi:hypothetical protein
MPPVSGRHTGALAEVYADPDVARHIGGATLDADGTAAQVARFEAVWHEPCFGQSALLDRATARSSAGPAAPLAAVGRGRTGLRPRPARTGPGPRHGGRASVAGRRVRRARPPPPHRGHPPRQRSEPGAGHPAGVPRPPRGRHPVPRPGPGPGPRAGSGRLTRPELGRQHRPISMRGGVSAADGPAGRSPGGPAARSRPPAAPARRPAAPSCSRRPGPR